MCESKWESWIFHPIPPFGELFSRTEGRTTNIGLYITYKPMFLDLLCDRPFIKRYPQRLPKAVSYRGKISKSPTHFEFLYVTKHTIKISKLLLRLSSNIIYLILWKNLGQISESLPIVNSLNELQIALVIFHGIASK